MTDAVHEDEVPGMATPEARLLLLQCVIAQQLAVSLNQVIPAANFREHLQADSLDIAALANRVEEEFSITITDDEAEECDTVAKAAALVERKVSANPQSQEENTHGQGR